MRWVFHSRLVLPRTQSSLSPQHPEGGLSSWEEQNVRTYHSIPSFLCWSQISGECNWELGTPFLGLASSVEGNSTETMIRVSLAHEVIVPHQQRQTRRTSDFCLLLHAVLGSWRGDDLREKCVISHNLRYRALARTVYPLSQTRVKKFKHKGTLKNSRGSGERQLGEV